MAASCCEGVSFRALVGKGNAKLYQTEENLQRYNTNVAEHPVTQQMYVNQNRIIYLIFNFFPLNISMDHQALLCGPHFEKPKPCLI